MCVILEPNMKNWSCHPETLILESNRQFFGLCDIEIWRMTMKITGHLFYATSSFVHYFVAVCEFKLQLQSKKTVTFGQNRRFFGLYLEFWRKTRKNNGAPVLSHFKLSASFRNHLWIETSHSPETLNLGKIFHLCGLDLSPCTFA